jgi:hypothetical protein
MRQVTIIHGPGEVVRLEVPEQEQVSHAVISVRSVVTAQHRAECVCGWVGPWSLFAGVVTASGNAHLAEQGV